MKKNAFTLAEVLVTLGIVGVVAALTLPNLMSDTTSAQIGPKLAKAVSSFEQANQAMLNDNGVDSLDDGGLANTQQLLVQNLQRYLKGASDGDNTFTTKDGISYIITIPVKASRTVPNPQDPPHMQRIGGNITGVIIDINGANQGPRESATDRFYFSLWNDGSLRPIGGTNWNGEATSRSGGTLHWTTKCPVGAVPADEVARQCCTGHIFENNFKVLYK